MLADALRRIRAAVKQNPLLETNSKIMWLHITTLFFHSAALSVTAFFVFRAFKHPNILEYQYQRGYSRIGLFTSQTIVQSAIIYLYLNFFMNKPKIDPDDGEMTHLATHGTANFPSD